MGNFTCPSKPRRGDPLMFVETILLASEDACITWPFGLFYDGYGRVWVDGRHNRAHRYVCKRAHGPPPFDKAEAAHSCGNRQCVNPKHIRWASRAENEADKKIHGTEAHLVGHINGNSKLSPSDVIEIRRLYTGKRMLQKDLSSLFGVDQTAISSIVTRKTWRHIP